MSFASSTVISCASYVLFDIPINLVYNPLHLYYTHLQLKYYLKFYTIQELSFISYTLFLFCKEIQKLNSMLNTIKPLEKCDDKDKLVEQISNIIPFIMKTIKL